MPRTPSLFEANAFPEGFTLQEDFLSPPDEEQLLEQFRSIEFHEMRMRGVTARRRVVQYGWNYSFESFRMTEGDPLPAFLHPVRDRAAVIAGVPPPELAEGLLMEYPPGATIGWHRDAPGFGVVVGISLLSPCRFRFRRGRVGAWETTEVPLMPRSLYVMTGAARSEWQHSIPAVTALRYSITFRTLRR